MIRAHRVNATAQDDASLVAGWNIAPNLPYILRLAPGASSCGVLLYDEDNMLVASGAALVGTDQPCVLLPQTGQTVGTVDADLGWHLLISTDGTESQREIRINPAVDLPDEIHPVYGDDDMGLARATAAIDEAAHYRDDVTATCPLGIGAGLGDVASVPVDGAAVVGQVESITWTATPDGASEQAVIRRHVAIAPEPYVEPTPVTPPTVADDTGATDAVTTTSGNVLTNDDAGLTIVAVNGLSASVGVAVDGDNGGSFVIAADGSWTFDPDGGFATLEGFETADTSVTYYASDGLSEAMATLTVTVSSTGAQPWTLLNAGFTSLLDAANISTVTVVDNAVAAIADATGNGYGASQGTSSLRPAYAGVSKPWFVPDFDALDDYFALDMIAATYSQLTVVALVRLGTFVSGGGPIFVHRTTMTSRNLIQLYRQTANEIRWQIRSSSTAIQQLVATGLPEWCIIVAQMDNINASHFLRINGVTLATNATTFAGTFDASYELSGVLPGGASSPYGGSIPILGRKAGIFTLDEIQKLEGRIARDWVLTDALPSDHPYKSTPPTI